MIRALLLAAALTGFGAGTLTAQTRKHDCDYCHQLHGASFTQLTARDVAVNLCQWCHDPDAPIGVDEIDGKVIPRKGRNQADTTGFSNHISGTVGITCRDCHDHEGESVLANGDTNLVLIPAQLTTPNSGTLPVTFRNWSADLSFADTIVGTSLPDATYRVCEVCHTGTTRYTNTDTDEPSRAERKSHNGRADCTTCHTHDTGFEGAGACTDCHSSVQDKDTGTPGSRRAVVSEFARASHHADAVTDADCEVCHDQSAHQAGNVILKNADGGASVTIAAYTDPATDSTEAAKLTVICLSCHSDGQAGTNPTPFADGITIPTIPATDWNNSSHASATGLNRSCFGDGAFGCHATAHGSERTPLIGLDPGVSPANGSDPLYYQEEGFCFNCHDADGPSTKNVKAGYDTSPLWIDDAVQYGPDDLNDRHDVAYADQQTTLRKVECANCHDPHAANASARPFSLVRTDPDPSDGRVPGSNWFLDSSGVATDAISEFCLDCHDGSWAPGVVDTGATPVLDILHGGAVNWYANSHGAGASGASLKSGTGYWQLDDVVSCLACHQAHPDNTPQQVTPSLRNNLFAMNDTIFGKDWTTLIPSDGGSYELTTLTARRNDAVNSYFLCNTCHTGSMGSGKPNCFDCHTHGDNRF